MTASASARDRHLFGNGPKRILSLDGGGVRGILSLGVLERLESEISQIEGAPTRLGDWFDLIGGTSTGAIIASGLALGLSVAELREFYQALAPKIFARSWRRLAGWAARFDSRVLARELTRVLGDRTLDSPDLRTGLSVLLKRLDTGSAWMLTNNPKSAFWADPADRSFLGNARLPLVNIVRASTAAPGYFDPERIEIAPGTPPGLFIDGGLTPHNNPALMLALNALIPAYGLNWTPGPDNLLVVSVGAGTYRPTMSLGEARRSSAIMLALKSLSAIIAENQNQVLSLMSYFGQSPVPWTINSEIGDLGPLSPPGGALFRFLRYDARLDRDWLHDNAGLAMTDREAKALRPMDVPANMPRLLEIGRGIADRQIRREHLAGFERSGSV